MNRRFFDPREKLFFNAGPDMALSILGKTWHFRSWARHGSLDLGQDMAFSILGQTWLFRSWGRESPLRSREESFSFWSGREMVFRSKPIIQTLAINMTWVSNSGPSILHTLVYLGQICSLRDKRKPNWTWCRNQALNFETKSNKATWYPRRELSTDQTLIHYEIINVNLKVYQQRGCFDLALWGVNWSVVNDSFDWDHIWGFW